MAVGSSRSGPGKNEARVGNESSGTSGSSPSSSSMAGSSPPSPESFPRVMSERSMSASPLPTPTTIPPTWKALAEACQDEELVDWQGRCKSAGVRYTTYTKRIRRDSRWWEYLLSELLPCDQERKVNVLLLEQALQ